MTNIICRKLHYTFIVLFFAVLLSSCITAKKINYLQKPSSTIPSYKDDIGYEEYVVAPTDKLYIKIYSLDDAINKVFNGNLQSVNIASSQNTNDYYDLYLYIVDNKGMIKLPMIGDVHVAGKNIREVKKIITNKVKILTAEEPAVDVKLVSRYFSVIGGSINGKYPIFREKMNIFQAIAMAGDISTFGDRTRVKILRETPKGIPTVKTFDIRSKDIVNSEFYYIQPNDVIYIQDMDSQFFSVTSLGSSFSTLFSTISFGILIYNIAKRSQTTTTNP